MKLKHLLSILGGLVLVLALLFPLVIYPFYQEKRRNQLLELIPDLIIKNMSLEEKVGQLIHVGMPGYSMNPAIRFEIEKHHVGGVILFGHNLKSKNQIKTLNENLQKLSIKTGGIPLFISADQEGGRVYRVPSDATVQFPGAMTLGQAGDPALTRDIGFITAHELNQIGINLVLAPVLDVNNNPANPVINTRSFGSQPGLVTEMGLALARGIREANSVPTIKHFPGHGDTFTDSHLDLPLINKNISDMEDLELAPFRVAIREGAEIVMSAHILYKKLDPENPATLSYKILTELLREKLGFQGLVMSDAMEMHAISKRYTRKLAVKQAFKAGVDIILLTSLGDISKEMYKSLLDGFKSGELSKTRLDISIRRQIDLKLRRGLFNIHNAPYPHDKELAEYFKEYFKQIDERLDKVESKYGDTNQNKDLNQTASLKGVSSLRKHFPGLGREIDRSKVRLFYRNKALREAALKSGMNRRQIFGGGPTAALSRLSRRKVDEVWLVEIGRRDQAGWNRFVKKLERIPKIKTPTLGLYSYNPFVFLKVPARGAILASYSPTAESRKALIYRALDGEKVKKTNLILAEK